MATSNNTTSIPYGYCHCGCGQKTSLAKKTDNNISHIKGEPVKYCVGHGNKLTPENQIIVFWHQIIITADDKQCWLWTGNLDEDGYGRTWFNYKKQNAHRVAWMYPDYVIPDGMIVCHSCDNPACCNPRHLFIGTYQDNSSDMVSKGRQMKNDNHYKCKLSNEQVVEIRDKYARGIARQYELAREYGVTSDNIWQIVHYRSRKGI